MIIFWVAQIVGSITILSLIVFIGGNIINDIQINDVGEKVFVKDGYYKVILFFLCEVFIAVAIIISWYKRKTAAFLKNTFLAPLIVFIILAILNFPGGKNVLLLHLLLLFSGLLLLFYAYYNEWILKKEKD